MNSPGNIVVCPSCGRRYSLSDFKSDRLVCSACGREIPRVLSIGDVDEAQQVKKFMRRCMWDDLLVYLLATPGAMMLFFWICTFDISWWRILPGIMIVACPAFVIREVCLIMPVYRIFSSHNYQLEPCKYAFQCWFNSLTDNQKNDVPSRFKDPNFLYNLENYVKSHAEINQTYEQVNGQMLGTPSSYYYVIPGGSEKAGFFDEYDYPPERCPGCGKLYSVGDFSSDKVQCRYCNKIISIRNCISDEDLRELCNEMLCKIRKDRRSTFIGFSVMSAILLVIVFFQIRATGFYHYFASWHWLTAFFLLGILIVLWIQIFDKESRAAIASLKSKNCDLLTVEIYMKKSAMGATAVDDNELIIAEFKRKLFDLYRSKGKVIGRY